MKKLKKYLQALLVYVSMQTEGIEGRCSPLHMIKFMGCH